jgi:hypothetical protein
LAPASQEDEFQLEIEIPKQIEHAAQNSVEVMKEEECLSK